MHFSGGKARCGAFLLKSLAVASLALALLLGLSLPGACRPDKGHRARILLLTSYHQGYKWNDDVLAGIRAGFANVKAKPQLIIEYLDAKRHHDSEYFDLQEGIFKNKYTNSRIDLIITSDNYAFDFLIHRVRGLFPDVPVVFCGLNNFDPGMVVGAQNFTGVNESNDLKATINLMLKLHPQTRHLFVINDQTVTGRQVRGELLKSLAEVPKKIKTELVDGLSMAQLESRLRKLGSNSLVLFVLLIRDGAGAVYDYEDSIERTVAASPVPVYAIYDMYLGHGIVGGMLTSGFYQGKTAAELAQRILKGEKPADIPVVMKSPNKYMFDYKALQRFSIPESALPDESIIINRPHSILETHPDVVASVALVIIVLLAAIVFLMVNTAKIKRAQLAARESEEKYAQIYENTSDLIYTHDLEGRLTAVNPALCRAFGYSAEELIGTLISDYMLPKNQSQYKKEYLPAVIGKGRHNGVSVYQNRKGEELILEYRSFIVSENGKPSHVSGTARDVTEKIRAGRSLKDSEERYRMVFNESPDAITISEMATARYIDVNQGFSQISGYSREEAVGKTLFELNLFVDPGDRGRYVEEMNRRGKVDNFEVQFRTKDGSIKDSLLSARKVRYGGQDCLAVVVRDQTVLKEAERAKAHLENQLQHAQKMEAIGTLAGGIAHDFNNILSAIMGFSELAQLKAAEKKDNSQHIEQVISAAERAGDLVKQLMTFSRRSRTKRKPIDLNQLVLQSEKILKRTLPKMITIETKLSEGPELIQADATQMEQVILNLANNARDAMPDGGRLTLETGATFLGGHSLNQHLEMPAGRYVTLTVNDTGHGMDEKTMAKIFDPFFTTKEIGKGTGLGLSTVYGIIKQHDGQIDCQSEPGTGTTFIIYLPSHQADQDEAVDQAEAEQLPPGGSETLLLVDDEEAIRELGQQNLEGMGYRVIKAASGEEALQRFERAGNEIDLVILDLGMPGMGGQRCLKELLAKAPDLKVLIASGYLADGKAGDSMVEGAAGSIAKPFKRNDLLATVRSVLDS